MGIFVYNSVFKLNFYKLALGVNKFFAPYNI